MVNFETAVMTLERGKMVWSVCYAPDGATIAVGGEDGEVGIYNTDGLLVKTLERDGKVFSVCYEPKNGAKIAVGGDDGKVGIYDSANGLLVMTLERDDKVLSVCYEPKNGAKIAVGGSDGKVGIYNCSDGQLVRTLKRDGAVQSVCYAPDGATIAVGGDDGKVGIYDSADGQLVKTIDVGGWVLSVCYAPKNDATIAVGRENSKVGIYNCTDGQLVHRLVRTSKRNDTIRSVCYAPDGATIAVGGSDGKVGIYDSANGQLVRTLERIGEVLSVCYAPDGTTIAIGGSDGDVGKVGIYSTRLLGQNLLNDSTNVEDQLGLKVEAEVLAEYLASTDLSPPFVLGIIGKWGQGKSSFFHIMKRRLIQLQKRKQIRADKDSFVGHIYFVNFDAWTYSKENLWSSLMFRIFKDLNKQLHLEEQLTNENLTKGGISVIEMVEELSRPETEYFDQLGEHGLDEGIIKGIQGIQRHQDSVSNSFASIFAGQVNQDKEDLKAVEKKIRDQLNQDKEDLKADEKKIQDNANMTIWSKLLQQNETVLNNPIQGAIVKKINDAGSEKAKELQKQHLEALFNDFFIIERLWIKYVASMPKISLLFVCLVAAISIGCIFLWDKFGKDLLGIIPPLGGLAGIITYIKLWASKGAALMDKCRKDYSDQYSEQIKLAREINADMEAGISQDSADVLKERLKKKSEIKGRLKILAGESMHTVVKNRVNSESYLEGLGIVHQAKEDLERLSDAMFNKYYEGITMDDNQQEGGQESMLPRGEPRIVLFVDDLDRCAPERVIDVLEAIQLLVKTKLFVVVVAIDSRYVCLSLETKKYKDILHSRKSPTGMDFLEKIIQIPFRLPGIDEDIMRSYVRGQIKSDPMVQDATPVSGNTHEQGRTGENQQQQTTEDVLENDLSVAVPNSTIDQEQPRNEDILAGAQQQTLTGPEALSLENACVSFRIVARSVKRVINSFKIMKIVWDRQRSSIDADTKSHSFLLLVMASSEKTRDGIHRLFNMMDENKKPKIELGFSFSNLYELVTHLCKDANVSFDSISNSETGFGIHKIADDENWLEVSKKFKLARCFSFSRSTDEHQLRQAQPQLTMQAQIAEQYKLRSLAADAGRPASVLASYDYRIDQLVELDAKQD